MDSSGSIRDNNPADGSYDNWELLLRFIVNLVDYFTIGPDDTRIGAVVFSDDARLEFPLNSFYDADQLKQALWSLQCIGQTTNTPEAIRIARQECFNPDRGDRPDVQNLAIIITDGVSHPGYLQMPARRQAETLRSTGARMIAVGITDKIDPEQLRLLSSLPQTERVNYFLAPSFSALYEIGQSVGQESCVEPSYGECNFRKIEEYHEQKYRFTNVCYIYMSYLRFFFSECQVVSDIVFLIDVSPVVQRIAIIDFIKDVISRIYVDESAALIAAVSFGADAKVEFGLGAITDKSQINARLDAIQFIGEKNTII